MKRIAAFLIVIVGLVLMIFLWLQTGAMQYGAEVPDLLVYQAGTSLMVFDPATGVTEQILTGWEIRDFRLSPDNRLAIASPRSGRVQVYLLDFPYAENSPVPLLLGPSSDNFPVSWSPDGQHLLIESYGSDNGRLILWEESRYRVIHYLGGRIAENDWSPAGQLAFTQSFYNSPGGDSDEIYLWDGITTLSLSQNPTGSDKWPVWSSDGRLAYLSHRNEEFDIYVWDGVSKKNGAPDLDTYVSVASGLAGLYSYPVWTNTDSLAFHGFGGFYIWNVDSVRNIAVEVPVNIGGPTWRADGHWAFSTSYYSPGQNTYILDSDNQIILEAEGRYRPAWSRTGYLVFCEFRRTPETYWVLHVWMDGTLIEAARSGGDIDASWNNGEVVVCSNG